MPLTRKQWLHKHFIKPDFGRNGDYYVLHVMCNYGYTHDLSDVAEMERAMVELRRRFVSRGVYGFSLENIREKVVALRRRYRTFTRFITLPGVHFNEYRGEIVRIGSEYNQHLRRETLFEKYYRLYGFPDYDLHRLLFDVNRAALLPKEIVGSVQQLLTLYDNDVDERDDDGDIGNDGGDVRNGRDEGVGSDDDGTVTQA